MTPDDDLRIDAGAPAPPPSETLRRKVAGMQPARTRSPLREAVMVALVMLALLALAFSFFHLRRDLAYLPRGWLIAVALSWLTASFGPLFLSLMPRRGQVLPDGRRALVWGVVGWCAMLAIAGLATASAPGHSLIVPPGRFWPLALHCCSITVFVFAGAFPPLLVALKRLVLVGGVLAGAAAGIAAGSLGGLLLHFVCAYAEPGHVMCGHVLAVLLCAILGGVAGGLTFSRAR